MSKDSLSFKSIFQRQTKLAAYIIICTTIVVLSASYALFFQVDSNSNNQVVEAGDLTFVYSNNNVINNSLCFEPMNLDEANLYANNCSYQLSIRNTGSLIADYNLFLVPKADNTADLSNLKIIIRENGTPVTGYPKGVVSGAGDSTHVGTTSAFLTGSINPGDTILYSAQIYVDDTTSFASSENKKVSFDIRGALVASDANPLNGTRPADATLAELQALNLNITVTPSTSINPNFTRIAPKNSPTYDQTLNSYFLANNNTSTYITYANDFTYDTTTGVYTLTDYTVCQYSSCYNDLTNKYMVQTSNFKYGSTANQAVYESNPNVNHRVIKVVSATSSGSITAKVYTGSELYEEKENTWQAQTSGLFESEDDYGKSYYFRGDIDYNYVKFGKWQTDYYSGEVAEDATYEGFTSLSTCQSSATNCAKYASQGDDMYWRIIRINGDGTIRMIYDGTSAHSKNELEFDENTYDLVQANIRSIGLSAYNTSYDDNAYVGYMYGEAGADNYNDAHENEHDSTIKRELDKWYAANLANTTSEEFISDTLFCNDRSIASTEAISFVNANSSGTNYHILHGYSNADTLYGSYGRQTEQRNLNMGNRATLRCTQKNDAYTVNDTIKGNGALTYPVGLITIDEANMAGGTYNINVDYYLKSGGWYWTMTPGRFLLNNHTGVGIVDLDGANVDYEDVDTYGSRGGSIRPVINLKTGIINAGNGTVSNPFRIE